jgi:hypothetical protein
MIATCHWLAIQLIKTNDYTEMYDAFTAALLLAGTHLAISYGAAEVWKVDYKTYLAITVGFGLIAGLILKVMAAGWKNRLVAAFMAEEKDGTLLPDVLLFVVTILLGGAASAYITVRRYGAVGWAGSLAANYMASWLI